MLSELHVKNFALIERADLTFREGLNVLSGETGAGKSILIDAIAACFGLKSGRAAIRTGEESAYIELLFTVDREEHRALLASLGTPAEEDGSLMVSRKIMKNRSVFRLNGEAVSAACLRECTELLLDIHGQHDHQSLLSPEHHLRFLDLASPGELLPVLERYRDVYRRYSELDGLLKSGSDRVFRDREREILEYEIQDIRNANLREGEEEELSAEFRRMKNASRIQEALAESGECFSTDLLSRAARCLSGVSEYDPALMELKAQAEELDSLLSDAARTARQLSDQLEYDPQRMEAVENRLDEIRRLLDRYAPSVGEIQALLKEKEARLQFLQDFEENREKRLAEREKLKGTLSALSAELSTLRKETAGKLREWVIRELSGLNFQSPVFEIRLTDRGTFGPEGKDQAEFFVSLNPGEPAKPLRQVASGGELSRIMLALKTVFSDQDQLETLIFDEIDTGISGRTAQKAAEKLSALGSRRQVLCITHLPQIAAMADHHYLIEKTAAGDRTATLVREIRGREITEELARLIGGTEITEGVLQTAGEMKTLAEKTKKKAAAAVSEEGRT